MPGGESSSAKIGQEYGDVRAPLPLDRLVPYLEQHVDGYKGPLEVKQFKVGSLALAPDSLTRPCLTP